MNKKVDMIVDLQYGSTGKGLIAGYLAVKHEYDTVITANMPNAGHTFIDEYGNKMVHKVLPNGIVSPKCKNVLIGPGAVFDFGRLIDEICDAYTFGYQDFKVYIHPNSVVLVDKHKDIEKININSIGSTQQGSAYAMIHKINRNPEDNPTSSIALGSMQVELEEFGIELITVDKYNEIIKDSERILAEGAQGFSLGINERFYPFCTSRDCTPARFMADMGIPLPMLDRVIGTARTYPIRVGGNSGGYYSDQVEITWDDVGVEPELTTVTQRERRVFTFSDKQIKDAIWACQPDEIFLNFCNYCDTMEELTSIAMQFHPKKVYYGWGPTVDDVFETDSEYIKVPEGAFDE